MAWLTKTTRAIFPVQGGFISSRYGQARPGREPHKGIDIAAPYGSPVLAILPGLVVATYKTGELTGYGNLVVLKHGPDAYSLYAHLAAIFVKPGQSMAAGFPIGSVGNTAGTRTNPGAETGEPHLHLEALTRWPPASRYADRVDPAKVLNTAFQEAADLPFMPRITTAAKRAAPLGFFFALLAAVLLLKKRA